MVRTVALDADGAWEGVREGGIIPGRRRLLRRLLVVVLRGLVVGEVVAVVGVVARVPELLQDALLGVRVELVVRQARHALAVHRAAPRRNNKRTHAGRSGPGRAPDVPHATSKTRLGCPAI